MNRYIRLLLIGIILSLTMIITGCDDKEVSDEYITNNVIAGNNESTPSVITSLPDTHKPKTSKPKKSYGILRVHFLDVGQADSILVESDKHYMLIDAGNNSDDTFVINYLKKYNVDSLDYVIGTHPHEDHIGGLDTVISTFDIGKIILPPVATTTKTFESVLDSIAAKNKKITKPVTGTKYSLGSASFTILSPNADYGKDYNNWSVGIRLTHGSKSFVLCGDAEIEAEKDIVNNNKTLKADVLKLGHHGSNTASTDVFLDAVNPSYAIISCGKGNKYNHPHSETLDNLEERKIKYLRTDISGTIVAESNGSKITFSTQK